jgi:hypothetical protein
MTIKELIEELNQFDPNKTINFIGSIEMGRGLSWIQVEDCLIEEEDGEVYLTVSGEEDEDGGYD